MATPTKGTEMGLTMNAARVKRGYTFDPECSRTTHRLQTTLEILRVEGIVPTIPDHDSKCIMHPDNAWNRCHGFNYHCECGRGMNPQPTWPDWVTDACFNAAAIAAEVMISARGQRIIPA